MKVLNISNSLDPVNGGGTVERTVQMSLHLAKKGIDCTILTTNVGLSPHRIEDLKGVSIVALPSINQRFFIPAFELNKIVSTIKEADIIHIMGHWLLLNALVYVIARYLKKKYVVCPAGLLIIYGRSKYLKKCYNFLIGRKIIKNADAVIAVTDFELPYFSKYGVNLSKIVTIPNGVNDDNCEQDKIMTGSILKNYGLFDCDFILYVGTLVHIKGPDLLLRAFCELLEPLNSYHLVFVGPDRGMLDYLNCIVQEYGCADRVHFLGYLGGAEKTSMYHAARLLAIPSRKEAMSIVALEAGIRKIPVLITDQCGFDMIADIDGGLVVPPTIEGLKRGLIEMLSDREKLRARGENLYKLTCEHYTWEKIVGRYSDLYDRLLLK